MIFDYAELKEFVREDFDRFYQMGFDESQMLPAILNEYEHGRGFCQTENVCIHIFLAQNYIKRGLKYRKIIEHLHRLLTEDVYCEMQQELTDDYMKCIEDLDGIIDSTSWSGTQQGAHY